MKTKFLKMEQPVKENAPRNVLATKGIGTFSEKTLDADVLTFLRTVSS